MVNEEAAKLKRTISVPVDIEMYNTIARLARDEGGVPLTQIVRQALYKCYALNNTELLDN